MRQEEINYSFAQGAGRSLKIDPAGHPVFGPGGIPGPVLDNCLTMNQQCKVCGEPAAGFHFGAFTCEGCKSFFGRTYNNLGSISECKNQGTCVINKKNRTSCKACRLRKCLLVGMSKSGSRYGRRSNWFKIHCLLQQQSQNQNPTGAASNAFYPGAFLHSPFLGTPGAGLPEFPHPGRDSESKEERSGSSHSDYSGGSSAGDNDNDSSRSPSTASFMRPPSSHQTPSPFSESELGHRKFVTEALRSPTSPSAFSSPPYPGSVFTSSPQGRVLFPPPSIHSVTRPGLTPSLMFLDPGCPPRTGGDLGLASPALAGVAEEQDQPIDLSFKGSAVVRPATPPASPENKHSGSRDDSLVKDSKDGVKVSSPLDLTSKPTHSMSSDCLR